MEIEAAALISQHNYTSSAFCHDSFVKLFKGKAKQDEHAHGKAMSSKNMYVYFEDLSSPA